MLPKFWAWLCQQYLGLPAHVTFAWWNALRKSAWTEAVMLHEAIVTYDARPFKAQQPQAVIDAISAAVAPQRLIAITEDLVTQRLLIRRDARVIEQAVLDRVERHGGWR
jgi:hypothetical protein